MNRGKVSSKVFLCFLMMMLLVIIGCGSVEDAIKDALPIHKISGTVYNSSNNGVSGVTVKLTGDESKSTTTNNDGKYEFDNLKNGNYTVKPDGYASKTVTIDNNDHVVNFTPVALPFNGTASGTYTWNSGTSTLTLIWTSSNFACNGPGIESEIETDVTITTTTMTMPNANNDGAGMTWTRPNGTAGDGAGTWTSTDAGSGDTYTLVVTATNSTSGTVSVSAHVTSCGSGNSSDTLSAGDYTATCNVFVDSVLVSSSYSYNYTLPADAPVSSISSPVCSQVEQALTSTNSNCSNPSCNMTASSRTSASLNLSCPVYGRNLTESCIMSK